MDLDADSLAAEQTSEDLLALDEALTRFASVDATAAELVKLVLCWPNACRCGSNAWPGSAFRRSAMGVRPRPGSRLAL